MPVVCSVQSNNAVVVPGRGASFTPLSSTSLSCAASVAAHSVMGEYTSIQRHVVHRDKCAGCVHCGTVIAFSSSIKIKWKSRSAKATTLANDRRRDGWTVDVVSG